MSFIKNNGYYFLILLMTAALVYFNYYTGLRRMPPIVLYALPFWAAFGLQYCFFRGLSFHRVRYWWVIVLGAPVLFALRMSLPPFAHSLTGRCLGYCARAACLVLPVLITGRAPGLRRPLTWRYVWILGLGVLVLVWLAARQPSFLSFYPRARFLAGSPWWKFALFEGCYGLDLFSMEFFFRGLLVLGLITVCGPAAIVPAAVFYCTVHFGKPMGECVSSFLGALLLGWLAIRTRSVYTGLLLHLELAWGMEGLSALRLPSLLP
jgi:hypothetical protein